MIFVVEATCRRSCAVSLPEHAAGLRVDEHRRRTEEPRRERVAEQRAADEQPLGLRPPASASDAGSARRRGGGLRRAAAANGVRRLLRPDPRAAEPARGRRRLRRASAGGGGTGSASGGQVAPDDPTTRDGGLPHPYNDRSMRTSNEIREGFLSFFEEKGHLRRPSASLDPARRTTARRCSTVAGMQPQMPFFLGREPPPAPLTTTAQKCFRTPDIDEVGLDTFHLTFFEMLGNFSFGEYFKEGAIDVRDASSSRSG